MAGPPSQNANTQEEAVGILASLEKQSKSFYVTAGLISIGIIGILDYLTGAEIAFSLFYVLPISLITWVTNRQIGLIVSFICATVWLLADITTGHPYSAPLIPLWNSVIRLAFFVIIVLLLSSLKNSLVLARTDDLTGAFNTRFFYEIIEIELNRFQRQRNPITLAYIDLDDLKAVNDELGHREGDQVLITLVRSIRNWIRKSDSIARLGGDEFAVLFPETDQEAARIVITKVLAGLDETMMAQGWSVTASVGVLTCLAAPATAQDMVAMADKLMYLAKADGKNTVRYSTYEG